MTKLEMACKVILGLRLLQVDKSHWTLLMQQSVMELSELTFLLLPQEMEDYLLINSENLAES